MKKYQTGVSLLELTIALGIILTISGVIAGGFASNRANARFDATRTELMSVATASSQLARNGNLSGISSRAIAESRLVPEAMIQGSGATVRLSHSLGGQFNVSSQPIPGIAGANAVRIEVTGLSRGRCEDAAITFAERFDVVTAGGTTIKNRLLSTPILPSRNTAVTACGAAPEQLRFFLVP